MGWRGQRHFHSLADNKWRHDDHVVWRPPAQHVVAMSKVALKTLSQTYWHKLSIKLKKRMETIHFQIFSTSNTNDLHGDIENPKIRQESGQRIVRHTDKRHLFDCAFLPLNWEEACKKSLRKKTIPLPYPFVLSNYVSGISSCWHSLTHSPTRTDHVTKRHIQFTEEGSSCF